MSALAVETSQQDEVAGGSPAVLRQQVAERLAAHRSRRRGDSLNAGVADSGALQGQNGPASARLRRIASTVAARYAQSQSYRAFLAAEAEAATHKARAAAEIATRTAHAVAAAEKELLEELAVFDDETAADAGQHGSLALVEANAPVERTKDEAQPSIEQISRDGLSIRLFEDAGRLTREEYPAGALRVGGAGASAPSPEDAEETLALDEEISFRQSPAFELAQPSVAIPGNLLEFPRQLVAARKARPRYAEGPLQADAEISGAQLRIFEVEAEQIAAAPPVESAAPEWSSIWLDAPAAAPVQAAAEQTQIEAAPALLQVASVGQRLMAAVVDACLVGFGFVAFAAAFAWRAAALPSMSAAAAGSAVCLAVLFVLYQMLFFTLSEATPGMRYARIGLCTFGDENPSRAAMRKRVLAVLLAACPLGLGFLWAWVDDDGLGWHDRMSRMYQRSY